MLLLSAMKEQIKLKDHTLLVDISQDANSSGTKWLRRRLSLSRLVLTRFEQLPHRRFAGILIGCVLLCIAIGLLLLVEWQPLISDPIGYLYAAKRIAAGLGPVYEDPNNALAGPYFSLYAFQIRRPDTNLMYLGFPPGLSLLLSIPLLFGTESSLVHLVVPATALLCIILSGILTWILTRELWAAFWAMLLLGVTPGLWYFGTAIWSEFPSAAIITAALVLYVFINVSPVGRWMETSIMVLLATLLAFNIYIRYTNLVVLLVFLAADGWLILKHRDKLSSHWPFWVLSGLAIVSVPFFNYFYYGGWASTSYSPEHGWYPLPAFSIGYAYGPSFVGGYSLIAGAETLWRNFGIFLPLAFIGWGLLKRTGVILAGISLAVFGLHSVYAFAPTGINARFLVPLFPLIAIGAATTIVLILGKAPRFLQLALASALFLVAVWQLPGTLNESARRGESNAQHVALIESIASATPTNAVFMSYPWNDSFAVYGNRSVFNYRRVPVSDPIQQQYRVPEAIPVIVDVITVLLEHDKPVYFVNNGDNFIHDLPQTLESHFLVETSTVSGIPVYKLGLPAAP